MTQVLKTTLKVTFLAWCLSSIVAWALISSVVDGNVVVPALAVGLGMASLIGIVAFGMLSFQHLREAQPVATASPSVEQQAPAPPDYSGFLKDLAMATACGIVVGIAVYAVMSQVMTPPPRVTYSEPADPTRIVPGIAGVLVFLAVFFRRLVLHMFPSARMPQARTIARRPAR